MPLGTHGRRTPIAYALGGGSADPEKNVALFNVVKKARADGVPKANIESALQKVRACVRVLYLVASMADHASS
jgi:hypothetical protein